MEVCSATNVWVGSETGLLKGVDLVKKLAANHFAEQKYGKDQEIMAMCWGDEEYSKIYTGHRSGIIREFNLDNGLFDRSFKIPNFECSSEELVGFSKTDDGFATCASSGKFCIFEPEKDDELKVDFNVGANVSSMRVNPEQNKIFATGGKENPLKIWDCENLRMPTFKAKNVPHDWLQLRVPVWVTGIQFLPQSNKVVTCTGTSKVRLYDPSLNQRRPCLEMNFDEYPLKAMTLTNKNEVIVGNTRGNMAMFDLRKKAMVHAFKGFAGSIRCIKCHPELHYVASCGLDRFLRIHHVDTGKLEHKVYLKSRLNTLLFSKGDFISDAQKHEQSKLSQVKKREIDDDGSEVEEDGDLWNEMIPVDVDERLDPPSICASKKNKRRKR